jgi:hypothetical protein
VTDVKGNTATKEGGSEMAKIRIQEVTADGERIGDLSYVDADSVREALSQACRLHAEEGCPAWKEMLSTHEAEAKDEWGHLHADGRIWVYDVA